MDQIIYEMTKTELRAKACFLRLDGLRNSKLAEALNLTEEQFRTLFKPKPFDRKRRNRMRDAVETLTQRTKKPKAAHVEPPKTIVKKKPQDISERVRRFQSKSAVNIPYGVTEVYAKFGRHPLCYLTGTQLDLQDSRSYELDHIIPVSKGGTSDLENMQFATPAANRMKNNHLHVDFIVMCKVIADWSAKTL